MKKILFRLNFFAGATHTHTHVSHVFNPYPTDVIKMKQSKKKINYYQAKQYLQEMAEKAKANRNQHALQQQQLQFQQQQPQVQPTNNERYSLLTGSDQRASSPPLVPKPLSVVLSFFVLYLCQVLFFFPNFMPLINRRRNVK